MTLQEQQPQTLEGIAEIGIFPDSALVQEQPVRMYTYTNPVDMQRVFIEEVVREKQAKVTEDPTKYAWEVRDFAWHVWGVDFKEKWANLTPEGYQDIQESYFRYIAGEESGRWDFYDFKTWESPVNLAELDQARNS